MLRTKRRYERKNKGFLMIILWTRALELFFWDFRVTESSKCPLNSDWKYSYKLIIHFILKNMFSSFRCWKVLEQWPTTNERGQWGDCGLQGPFALNATRTPWRNGWLRVWETECIRGTWKILLYQRKGSCGGLLESSQKDPGAKLTRPPFVKDKIIWASEIIA